MTPAPDGAGKMGIAISVLVAIGVAFGKLVFKPAAAAIEADVIIIGGGASGISAAAALARLNLTSVILEAHPQLGGRLHSAEFAGAHANVGASWIHHADSNPIAKLAQKFNCRTKRTNNTSVRFFGKDGTEIDSHVVNQLRTHYQTVVLSTLRHQEAIEDDGVEGRHQGDLSRHAPSLADALLRFDPKLQERTYNYTVSERTAMELHYFRDVVQDLTTNLRHVNSAEFDKEIWGGTGHDLLMLDSFMCLLSPLVEAEATGGRVMLQVGEAVKQIFYGADLTPSGESSHAPTADQASDTADYTGVPPVEKVGGGVLVVTESGGRYKGRRAVVTVPLAVLQASDRVHGEDDGGTDSGTGGEGAENARLDAKSAIEFVPPLPGRKQAAIRTLGVGQALRVALHFAAPFWLTAEEAAEAENMEGAHWHEGARVWGGEGARVWPGAQSLVMAGEEHAPFGEGEHIEFSTLYPFTGVPVLIAETEMAYASRLEALSDEELAAELVGRLRIAFGGEKPSEKTSEKTSGAATTTAPADTAATGGTTEVLGVELLGYHPKRFGADPFTRGGFSYHPRGSNRRDRWEIERPEGRSPAAMGVPRVKGRDKENDHLLFFAGEHTSQFLPGTVDGAFLSGLQAAQRVGCSLHVAPRAIDAALLPLDLFDELWLDECLDSPKDASTDGLRQRQCCTRGHTFWEKYSRCRDSKTLECESYRECPEWVPIK
jgi:monoamine oxidase